MTTKGARLMVSIDPFAEFDSIVEGVRLMPQVFFNFPFFAFDS
jgi:hypothetical protein